MAKTIFNIVGGIITPCNVARSWHWLRQLLYTAMWHVDLESWQWIHQVAAPCDVIRGSGKTCRWIHPVAAPCNVAVGSGITYHGIRPNFRHIEILHWFRFWPYHVSAKFYPNRTTLSRKKLTSCRFSRWRISAILDFRRPIMGSLKLMYDFYKSSIDTIALNCLVFEKIPFFCILATDRQTNKQMNNIDALDQRLKKHRVNWLLAINFST